MYNNLAHFGIKNMKWGVRNYQNKDGSLTTLGRIRYGSPRGKMIKKSVDLYENFPKRQPGESDKAYLKRYNKHDDLCHHGIKGQKRGVRRYQNTDGSLTPAGKQDRKSVV